LFSATILHLNYYLSVKYFVVACLQSSESEE
jgi:hypothetical protein